MKKYIMKALVLFLLIIICIQEASIVFVHSLREETDANNEAFYEMKKDTIDVILVGSSHIYCGFAPQILKDEFDIEAFDLASPNQNVTVDYLYAKEAYDYQKYKVLLVDANSLYTISNQDYFIMSNLKSIASMYPSKHYYEYMKYVRKKTALQFAFPIFIVHDRWKNLDKNAFSKDVNQNLVINRGFMSLGTESQAGENAKQTISKDAQVTWDSLDEIDYGNIEHLDNIREFCHNNNIIMIMVKTIQAENDGNIWNYEKHTAVQTYCDKYNILFYDFNVPEIMEKAGLDVSTDVALDLRHANENGAVKETRYLGKVLTELLNN